jgi:hypothetical protein
MPSRNSRQPVNQEESGLSILVVAVPLGASAFQAGSPTASRQRPMTARSGAIPNTKKNDAQSPPDPRDFLPAVLRVGKAVNVLANERHRELEEHRDCQ